MCKKKQKDKKVPNKVKKSLGDYIEIAVLKIPGFLLLWSLDVLIMCLISPLLFVIFWLNFFKILCPKPKKKKELSLQESLFNQTVKREKKKRPGLISRIKTAIKVTDHYLSEVLLISSPTLSVNPKKFVQSVFRTLKQSLARRRPELATLMELNLEPDVSIEDYEKEVESLFIAVDRDGNKSLDMKELRFFVRQFIAMCSKAVKNTEDEDFDHFILDPAKIKLLEEWPSKV